jgi:hypothetical protein
MARGLSSRKYGISQITGRRHKPWRSIERKIATAGLPIDWKYVVATTLTDMHHIMQFATWRA